MSFIPPADWQKTYVGDAHIYWIRLRCSDPGAAELVFRSVERVSGSYVWEGTSGIHGQPYGHRVDSDGKNCLVISGWDMANDLNGDGYIDDTEFSIRKNNKASARFLSNAIVPADYFSNRWVMNIGHPVVSGYFATASKDAMNDAGMDGLFVDNSVGWIPDLKKSDYRYLEYPQGDHEAKYLQATVDLHRAIKEQAGNRPVFLNSGGIYPDVVAPVDGSFIEWAFTFDNSSKVTPVFLSSYLAKVNMYKKLGKQVVLSAGPANWDNVLPADLAKERHQLYSLAMYYLLAQENTYFEYFLSNAPWQDWAKAFEVDIGKPLGDFYLYKQLSGHDFSSSSSNLMANASFEAKKTGNLSLPDGWINSTWYGAGVGETVSQSGKFGDYALRLDSDSKNNCGGMFQYIALKPNTTYTLGAWIKTENLVSDYSLAAEVIVYGGKSGGDWRAG
ncbi:MAG: putative glycoside hydrolase [Candidatus Omnitrophota bacterium]